VKKVGRRTIQPIVGAGVWSKSVKGTKVKKEHERGDQCMPLQWTRCELVKRGGTGGECGGVLGRGEKERGGEEVS